MVQLSRSLNRPIVPALGIGRPMCDTALIVCGGRGSRLGPLGEVVNKALLPFDGEPIGVGVVRAVQALFGCDRIVFLTSHLGWQLEAVFPEYIAGDLVFVDDQGAGGTAQAVMRAAEKFGLGEFVYAHGNIVLSPAAQGTVRRRLRDHVSYDSLLLTSRAPIAPTHPRLRLLGSRVTAVGDDGSAFSVGMGYFCGIDLGKAWSVALGETWEGFVVPSLLADGVSLDAVDISEGWRHLEDLNFYGSSEEPWNSSWLRRLA